MGGREPLADDNPSNVVRIRSPGYPGTPRVAAIVRGTSVASNNGRSRPNTREIIAAVKLSARLLKCFSIGSTDRIHSASVYRAIWVNVTYGCR